MIKLKLNWFGSGQGFLGLTDKERTVNGITYNTDIIGTGGNWNLNNEELDDIIKAIVDKGGPLTDAELRELGLTDGNDNDAKYKNIVAAQNQIIANNKDLWPDIYAQLPSQQAKQGLPGIATEDDGQVSAFNAYYNDVYSLSPGTGGAEMLQRLEQSYENQAQQQATMADVGFQQAALQQANVVKQITDQVRSERMARLRAGMSESQIANQDMQMLMTNVNTLNQNAAMLNQQRLQAQIGMNTAQDQAYADYLNQANARGQVATGMAASDASDAYQQTIRRMSSLYGTDPTQWKSGDFTREYNIAATGNPAGNTNK